MGIEVVKITDLKRLIKGSKYIGKGKSGKCFLLQNGELFKLYKDTPNTYSLFHCYNMLEHLKELFVLNNTTYVAPKKIYVKDGEVIGYSMDYVSAKTLYHLNKRLHLNVCIEALKQLEEDTSLVSEKRYSVVDCHGGNILYDYYYHVIDLDPGYFNSEGAISTSLIMETNMKKLFWTIIDATIGNRRYINEEIYFYNQNLNELYRATIYKDYQKIYDFFGYLQEEIKKENPTIRDVQRLKRRLYYHKESYYSKF